MFNINEVLAADEALNPKYKQKTGFDANAVLADANRLNKPAGFDPGSYLMQLAQSAQGGLLETPNYQRPPGIGNTAAYYASKYGPEAAGATLGSMLPVPGLGPVAGMAVGNAVGAGMGRSLQNLQQAISAQISPGSAPQKTPTQLITEPTTSALTQGILGKITGSVGEGIKGAASKYFAGTTGVKLNLMERAFDNINRVMASPSVKKAGEAIGALADKAGIKTGDDGLELASGSILGAERATGRYSAETIMNMADQAKRVGYDAMTPQEMYSTAEGLRKAISAPKYRDPHGMFSQNFRRYAGILGELEDRLEGFVPGYTEGRSNYADALTKEALSFFSPLNQNMSANQLKLLMGTGYAGVGAAGLTEAYRTGTGKAGPAEMLLTAGLLSPLLVGKAIQAGSMAAATKIPQMLGRGVVAAGSETLANALSNQNQ